MATQRYISTSFWDDEWIHKLDPSEKLMYLYFMTNTLTNIAGVYKISIERIVFDTGFNENTIKHIIEKFQKAKKCYYYQGWIIIPSWPKHQKWQTKGKIRQGIDIVLLGIPEDIKSLLPKIGYTYPIDTIYIPTDTNRYQPNYLDPDLNSDSDLDSDLEGDRFSPPQNPTADIFQPEPAITEASFQPDYFFHPCQHAELWNSFPKLPKFTRTRPNVSPADLEPIRKGTDGRTTEDIQQAIRNYATVQGNPDDYHAPFPYQSLLNFLAKGVEVYSSLEPYINRRNNGRPEMTEERAAEIARSLQ